MAQEIGFSPLPCPQEFPEVFPKPFPKAFPQLDADWLALHHPLQMLNFHQSLPC